MPKLINWLAVALFPGLIQWFAKFFTKKVAGYAALAASIGAAWGVMYAAVAGIEAGIATVMPPLMVKAVHLVKPTGFDGIISAYFGVRLALAVYKWHRDTIRAASFVS